MCSSDLRGENISVIFVNNGIYGMTSGQMAPTTLIGQKSTTSPRGRDPKTTGYPIKMSEMLALQDGAAYIARCSLHNPAHIMKARAAILKAFRMQVEGKGFTLVELLSSCPVGWNLTPANSLRWLEEKVIPVYPLGDLKDISRKEADPHA